MMSFVATLLLGGIVQTAHAVEWPDISEPATQAIRKSNDRAIIIALEEYERVIGVRQASTTLMIGSVILHLRWVCRLLKCRY